MTPSATFPMTGPAVPQVVLAQKVNNILLNMGPSGKKINASGSNRLSSGHLNLRQFRAVFRTLLVAQVQKFFVLAMSRFGGTS
jgi:hypothetical protein